LKPVHLYDTYEGKVVDFKPIVDGEASIYYCGPTVYNYVHVGNLRPVIVFDLLHRVLLACGYKVKMISNYTDIDDKIINKALAEHKSEKEVSDFYIAAYEDVLAKLHIMPLDYHPRVSNYIPEIVDFIKAIMDKGHAYKADNGDVYFSVSDDPYYGSLSKIKPDELQAGARIETGEEKRSPLDFALWKNTSDAGVKFDSAIGRGRPGWHTECVVMINSYFKKPCIDIHGGGFDLKFPHHENEMAQAWAYADSRLANIWMHVGFLEMNGTKMSKSLGNVVLAKDAVERFGGNAIRHFFLTTYYRSPVNYTDSALDTSMKEVERWGMTKRRMEAKIGFENLKLTSDFDAASFDEFLSYLADDLNVANAITVMEKIIKNANNALRNPRLELSAFSSLYNTYSRMLDLLGFDYPVIQVSEEDKADFAAFNKARADKDFAKSDELRKKLMANGLM
jgi:cysteinyl-tRNA synthetase